jgi:hypothetical protein
MRRVAKWGIAGVVGFLVACGGSPQTPLTAQAALDAFKAAGINVSNVQPITPDPNAPLPRSFKENVSFEAPGSAPAGKGGQIFVCDTKANCDAIFAYYDALKGLAGPYLYRDPSGLVVAQLNSGMTPDAAKKFQDALQGMK